MTPVIPDMAQRTRPTRYNKPDTQNKSPDLTHTKVQT